MLVTAVGDKKFRRQVWKVGDHFYRFRHPHSIQCINKYEPLVVTFQECHQNNNSVTNNLKLSPYHDVANTIVAFLDPLALQTRLGIGFQETSAPSFQAVASDILF